ncbi:efflux transporter outer membrane subunit [Sphingomonas xinjiangensis]|uniref:NodT family efflux transporter outer membrane factor (OMF) lipoprotein n=1 Tax=Sphingomonas xinjiangensis TaxID=643568 RepID=A0A840YNN1_9SPHN|nr:efflux transporter outer membrane subunit [Sphingomonas xinjiangensis]MBB5709491.1 NodT family efflux transporter outer membrane factor (OMF) lipoprotein [Sphingomonas xinjiangensis]
MRILFATASALALAACAAGPDYVAPEPPQTAAGSFVAAHSAVSADPLKGDWWRLYNDPVLDGLVADALAANTDVRAAVARIERARALLRGSRANQLPQVGLSSGANYGRLPEIQRFPGSDRENWQIDAGLDVNYEADLFGRLSRGVEASRGDLGAAEADADAVRVIIVADTTQAYADAASALERLQVAQRIVALLDQSINLTERRRSLGGATRLDTARIGALRNERQAQVPALQAQRDAALFRLAMLTGRAPAALPPVAAGRTTTLRLSQPIPVGDGAALLARRPDIRVAERQLAAATARIGVATADLYPRITLGASGGSTGTDWGDVFGAGPLRWLVGGLINWAVNPGPARARVAAAEATSREALANFDGAVLRALQETETALSAYGHALDRRTALQAARNEAEAAVNIARARQREGDIDSLALLDAERTFADAEATLAAADAFIADTQIDLFRALGGGWQA